MRTKKQYSQILMLQWKLKIKPASLLVVFLLSYMLLSERAIAQQTDKIQAALKSIKDTYYCKDQDYHTDGQRTVWVKYYKDWVPGDLIVMKKEAPHVLKFLNQAIQRDRLDVLEQVLPNYYRAHGGVKAFAAGVKEQVTQ